MMLIQSSLPSSVESALSFESEHGKQDLLCYWILGAETWQKGLKCHKHSQGGCRKFVQVAEGEKDDDDSHSLNFQRSCSDQSTNNIMCGRSMPPLVALQNELKGSSMLSRVYRRKKLRWKSVVYQRKKLRKRSVVCAAEASTDSKPANGSVSAISSEATSVAGLENIVLLVEAENEAARCPDMLPVECNTGALISKSESFTGSIVGEGRESEEALTSDTHKVLDLCCSNDACSSSKSNMDIDSSTLKPELDDAAECSSSGTLVIDGLRDDMSEKDICISIIRSHLLLERVLPTRTSTSVEATCINSNSCHTRSCKICGSEESALKMLICDHCEEAFHMSCCNPRIKKIPDDEWLCHSCLKKKHKILKEKETSGKNRCLSANSKAKMGSIALMLHGTEPSTSNIRIGEPFQAQIPDWSGPIIDEVDPSGEPWEMSSAVDLSLDDRSFNQPLKLSSIGNWLQCQEATKGVDGTICGKWRRAPLFEVQTDNWECFCSVLWDPTHADCSVPQELDTDEVLKQLKYIEMLRPRLASKLQRLGCDEAGSSQDHTEDARNIQSS